MVKQIKILLQKGEAYFHEGSSAHKNTQLCLHYMAVEVAKPIYRYKLHLWSVFRVIPAY